MITGDNPLTACAVAREVAIVERDVLIADKVDNSVVFQTVDESIRIEVDPNQPLDQDLLDKYDVCLTGSAMDEFMDKPNMKVLLEHTWVYARVSPAQKVVFRHLLLYTKHAVDKSAVIGISSDRLKGFGLYHTNGW